MKQVGLLACALLLTFGLIACNGVQETPTPPVETPEPTPPVANGPAAQGEAIFTGQDPVAQPTCSTCHSVGEGDRVGPDLQGVATRAAERIPGLTAEEYLRQAVVDPNEHVVEGFSPAMPTHYGDQLSEEQLDALIAYLMTLE